MYIVKFIGGRKIEGYNNVFGGTPMTISMFEKSFKNDTEFRIDIATRQELETIVEIKDFIKDADIIHIDDYQVYKKMIDNGIIPDVIGITIRTPAKKYKDWNADVSTETFYKSEVVRLNNGEEKNTEYEDKINYIIHAVDLDLLKPNLDKTKKYILWAGDIRRSIKNYEMFEEIMKMELPIGFEFKVLSNYNVDDYWKALEETAILVNTSKSESFCCALFEAKAKGVATIYRKGLHSAQWKDSEIQVEYNIESYQKAILNLLEENGYIYYGKKNREYAEQNNTFEKMKDSYKKVYKQILNKKQCQEVK